jgi:type IV fimbrial biogenesis protein FimT
MKSKSFADVHYVAHGSRAVESIIGFTLIELMVTLTVGGILAAMAVPAFNSFVLNDRQVGQLNSLASSLNYARSEAVKRNLAGGITVCPNAGGATCSGTDWFGGWIVTDSNPLDPPLQTVPALAGSGTWAVTGSQTGVTFQSSGMVTPSATTTFTVCDVRGAAFARELEVNSTGRVASSSTQGISVSGAPLVCP